MRPQRQLALVAVALFGVAAQLSQEIQYWLGQVRVGAAAEVPCDEENGTFDAIEFGLQAAFDIIYQDSENMNTDKNGVPAKAQYNPDGNQIWINKDDPDHKDAEGSWTDDAKVSVGHEAIHSAFANGGVFQIHGLGELALSLGEQW